MPAGTSRTRGTVRGSFCGPRERSRPPASPSGRCRHGHRPAHTAARPARRLPAAAPPRPLSDPRGSTPESSTTPPCHRPTARRFGSPTVGLAGASRGAFVLFAWVVPAAVKCESWLGSTLQYGHPPTRSRGITRHRNVPCARDTADAAGGTINSAQGARSGDGDCDHRRDLIRVSRPSLPVEHPRLQIRRGPSRRAGATARSVGWSECPLSGLPMRQRTRR